MKKKFSVFLAIIMVVVSIPSNFAIASNSDYLEELLEKENILVIGDDILEFKDNCEIEERSVTGVTVFLGGVLVAYIIDGVVIYVSGKSGGEWVAEALRYLAKHPHVKSIYLNNNNGYDSSYDCSVYPPNSQQGCKP